MNILSKYIIKEHITPFLMALSVLLFVLLANFLLKSIDKFLGKGLDLLLLIEFIFLNLAWILALAVPMSVLVATLMAFGRLSSDNEITAIRSSGIGFLQLLLPNIYSPVPPSLGHKYRGGCSRRGALAGGAGGWRPRPGSSTPSAPALPPPPSALSLSS